MKVSTEIHEEEVEGDYGFTDGLRVHCSKCGHYVDVFGTSDASARRAAMVLREECPLGEQNYYDVSDWQ